MSVLFRKQKSPGLSKIQTVDFISRINKDLFERLPCEKVPRQRAGEGKVSHRTRKHMQVTGLLKQGGCVALMNLATSPNLTPLFP